MENYQIEYEIAMQENKELIAHIKELEAEIKSLRKELRSASYGRCNC